MLFASILLCMIPAVISLIIPCSDQMCYGKSDGNYEYHHPDQSTPSDPAYFLSCVNHKAYCRFCWPITLQYSPSCDQCLHRKDAPCWPPKVIPGKVEKGWTTWSESTPCSKTCGMGLQTRTRTCRKTNGKCPGSGKEFKNCLKKMCTGVKGVMDMQWLVMQILQKFFEEAFSQTKVTGKVQRAMFQIYKSALQTINLGQTGNDGESNFERTKFIKEVIKKAIEAEKIAFARMTLGKIIVVYIKIELQYETPLQDIIDIVNIELKQIKRSSGQKFDQVFVSNGEATLMFAMDTTGSMKNEIEAAKTIASGIVSSVKGHPIDCILSPFNDPHTGPVTKTSSNQLNKCVAAIDQLEAKLGGDCPELAYRGMLDAIKSGPKFGSPLFVFTDAAARDGTPENIAELKTLAEANSVTINFLLTESDCLLKENEYSEIALSTNGQLFPLRESELGNLVNYVKSSLFIDTFLATGDTKAATKYFDVDSNIALLIVTVTIKNVNTAKFVDLVDPKGHGHVPNVTLATVCIFEIVKPLSGRWKLAFPFAAVGNLTFNVEAISDEPIEFDFNFLAEIDNKVFSVFNPIADEDNTIIVRLAGWKLIKLSTLKIDTIDEIGIKLEENLMLKQAESSHVFNGNMIPPPFPFKVILKGQKKDSTNFQRVSRKLVSVQYSFLQVAKAGNDSTFRIGEKNGPIKIQVLNTRSAGKYKFSIKCNFGSVSPTTMTLTIDKIGYVDFTYNAPSDPQFTIDTISVTAEALSSIPHRVHYSFEVLLVP